MRELTVMMARIAVVLGLVLLSGTARAGGLFRFEDDSGTVHYTNVPSDPRYQLLRADPEPAKAPEAVAAPVPARGLQAFVEAIRSAAERHQVDRRLVEAVVQVESGGNPNAVSPKGAQGLMQLMPQRSVELGVRNPFNPVQNLEGGVRHLRELLERFAGNVTHALAAYNAGEAAVRAHGGIPPYPETRDYVRKVRALYEGNGRPAGTVAKPVLLATPQQVYREVAEDGAVVFTNVPPAPGAVLARRL